MIAEMADVPLYVVHTSCEEAHEAIRRARQRSSRVFGESLIQHLVLDETEYFSQDWDHAARRVMSPPFRNKKHQNRSGRFAGRLSASRGNGSRRIFHETKALGARGFHENSQWHGRHRGSDVGALDTWRQQRPAYDE